MHILYVFYDTYARTFTYIFTVSSVGRYTSILFPRTRQVRGTSFHITSFFSITNFGVIYERGKCLIFSLPRGTCNLPSSTYTVPLSKYARTSTFEFVIEHGARPE